MNRIKIFIVVAFVLLVNALTLYDQYTTHVLNHDGLFFSLKNIVGVVVVISALVGLFLKKELGWILTSSLLYTLFIAGITVPFKINLNVSAFAYGIGYLIIFLPILFMNSAALIQYYKVNPDSGIIRRTAIVLVISTAVSILMN